jgi:eukaryotic-like serine/threonine-protein kinase
MPTDRWHRVEQLFLEAVEQPAGERAGFLARTCGPDAGMRDEIASLLTAVEQSGEFLSAPALDVFARQISREGWSVQPGDRVASYTVERRLGAGGMGEVWRARDERLGRDVAIKLLLPHPSNAEERGRALQQEARAAGTLNHTNVLTVYDVGDHDGAPYLVTECLEGEPLRARLGAGALSVDTVLDVALQVARGLGAAHARGIVHRDLKPENIFLTRDGRVKILDFGLATLHDAPPPASPSPELPGGTTRPLVAGTVGYMAPEQVRGEVVDGRADIFALGAVLYEMLAGRRAFKADSTLGTLEAVLTLQPPDLSDVRRGVPPALSQLVRRCLAKSPDGRLATAAEVVSALDAVIRARNLPPPPSVLALFRRPAVMVTVLLVSLAMAAAGWRWRVATSRARWARTVAAPEIQRLSNHGDYVEAFLLTRQALDVLPEDRHLYQLWLDVSIPGGVTTDPAGAEVELAPYRTRTPSWFSLGRTPLNRVRIPRSLFRVRISKAGFQTIEGSGSPPALRYRLDPSDAVPPGMVRVVGDPDPVREGLVGVSDDYWIDRFEVTNRQFKEFVDQGGYGRRDYWREPFIEGLRSVPWEEAALRFRDATGRPGPATWKSGTYADGQAEFPVGGVSWYEAAAYAAFAGKSLPTIHHWYGAAGLGRFMDILWVSNFDGKGPAPVGSHHGLGPFGTYDMAGNLKEWCWTETNHRRFLVGGAWNEPMDMFADYDAKGPFERAPGYGFRLAKYIRPLPPAVTAPVRIESLVRDVRKQKPVGDDIFAVYRRQYAYDRAPLSAVLEGTEETEIWRKDTVTFDAAYGGERVRAHLFLPKTGSPPYQTVIFFPAADAFRLRSSRDLSLRWGDFIIRSGRAFLYPVYKGTYERATFEPTGPSAERELRIAWSRDLGRAIDYLETRSDIDRTRLALYALSEGADCGVILTALEPRLKTSVLQGTGIEEPVAPELDSLNYAPRVRMPTLMLNGRYDYETPFHASQRPLFALLGSPAEHKRHVALEFGHALVIEAVAREVLPWLDRYLGPVVPSSPASTPTRAGSHDSLEGRPGRNGPEAPR